MDYGIMLFRHSIPILLSTVLFNIHHLDTYLKFIFGFLILLFFFSPEFVLNFKIFKI